jgi:hypothetical protein
VEKPSARSGRSFFVTPKMLAGLDDRQRSTASLVFSAYREEVALRGARNPLAPELEPYRRLFR